MANLSLPSGLASAVAAALNLTDLTVTGSYFAADGNPDSARVYPDGSELTRVYPASSQPGVTAQGDDRDHE